MNFKKFLIDFFIFFIVVFVVSGIVTYLYGLIVHQAGNIDWENSFRLAIILAIVLPLTRLRESK